MRTRNWELGIGMRTRLSSLLIAALAAVAVRGHAVTAQTPPVVVVVELFTSEGCSSCPPADSLLADLMARQPIKGAAIVGLSEHVDYWDSLGWKDPFSDAKFSARQTAYGAATGADVYTPQMIVDGGAPFAGHDRRAALAAITHAAAARKTVVHLSWEAARPDGATAASPILDVSLDGHQPSANARVVLAVTEDGLTSAVKRGENNGRSLTHSGVARRFVEIGRAGRDGSFHKTVPVSLDPSWRRTALRVVVFVQSVRLGPITGAGEIDVR